MFVTVAHFKGGVGKTTTAVHLAGFLQGAGRTLLIDGDPNRSATKWAARKGFPFDLVDEKAGTYQARNYDHVVIDTEARPGTEDLKALAGGCDLLVIPSVPATMDSDALAETLHALQELGAGKYRVLLTKVPPAPETDGPQLRAALEGAGVPIFKAEIPRLKVFEKAVNAGVLVRDVEDDSRAGRAWQAYEATGKELTHG